MLNMFMSETNNKIWAYNVKRKRNKQFNVTGVLLFSTEGSHHVTDTTLSCAPVEKLE